MHEYRLSCDQAPHIPASRSQTPPARHGHPSTRVTRARTPAPVLGSSVPRPGRPRLRARTEQFLADGARTLASLGLTVETVIRNGPVVEEMLDQLHKGGHDLLMVGAPLAPENRRAPLAGIISQVLSSAIEQPILIVRSRYAQRNVPQLTFDGRIKIIEEIRL